MAKGFEKLISDEFASVFPNIMLLPEGKKELLMAFSENSHPTTYPSSFAKTGLAFTPLEHLAKAFNEVPREAFIHPQFQHFAYSDAAIPIWHNPELGTLASKAVEEFSRGNNEQANEHLKQMLSGEYLNTSQPMLILKMLALANIQRASHVMEIGSGCGYATALAAKIASSGKAVGVEIKPEWKPSQGYALNPL